MSKRWYHKHVQDAFVKKANKEGVRSRAAYKLLEIQKKRQLIKKGDNVIDLGSAPGAWSQALVEMVGNGKVIACDLLDMEPIKKVVFVKGDFLDTNTQAEIVKHVDRFDVIVSDMAPNLTGNVVFDQVGMNTLLEMVLQFAKSHLKEGGHVVCKGFHGVMFEEILALFKQYFNKVKVLKPEASRSESKEIYLIGEGFGV